MRLVLAAGLTALWPLASPAQPRDYFYSGMIEELDRFRTEDLEALPEVRYSYYVVQDSVRVIALNRLLADIGAQEPGREGRKQLVQLLNRNALEELRPGDTLIVPSHFDVDGRAYSPFPRYYPGARGLDKLFVIDKSIQGFGAYERGRLVRWGVVSTGALSSPTPNGRYNFNWKTERRISTLSPPGEEWLMTWVFNFHETRGIHTHEYAMPASGPASHGCVRLLGVDARWLYEWADGWLKKGGVLEASGAPGNIVRQGTTVIVIGKERPGTPELFLRRKRHPVMRAAELPADPFAVPPGTPQQVHFDRLRQQAAKAEKARR